jgi:hypothetical protein
LADHQHGGDAKLPETKVYWRSPDGNDARTTIIPGKGIQTFQTAGEFKLEAVGEPNREVNYVHPAEAPARKRKTFSLT